MAKREFPALIAEVLEWNLQVIINRGSEDNIRLGARFLIYELSREIMDPETHESLGKLEVSKGTGKVSQVQEKLSVITSDMENALTGQPMPFRQPIKRGDRAKPL